MAREHWLRLAMTEGIGPILIRRIVEAAARMPGVIAAGAGQGLPRIYPQPRPTAIELIGFPMERETSRVVASVSPK